MLHSVTSFRKHGSAQAQDTAGGVTPLRQPAAATPHRTPAPTRFEDFPNEIVYDVADHVFKGAVGDQNYDVESLACNRDLQSMLSAELRANAVLRKIHSARTFAQLATELADVRQTSPFHRQGCLLAAIRLLPRLGPGDLVPETLWSEIRALLPHASSVGSDGTSARDTVLLALVEAVRSMQPGRPGCLSLENILAAMDPQAPVSPALETALVRWAREYLPAPYVDIADGAPQRDRLLQAAPPALRARMQALFDFVEHPRSDDGKFTVATMAREMRELDDAQAAGQPDRRWRLQQCTRLWCVYAMRSAAFQTLYRTFFSRLDPSEQVWLAGIGQSPLAADDVAPFLAGHVGRLPSTTLLRVLAYNDILRLKKSDWSPRSELVRNIVGAAMGTPEEIEVLQAAINYESIQHLELRPFFERCIAASDPQRRAALTLRMDVAMVGSGEYDTRLAPKRAAMSARLDTLLEDVRQTSPHTIETIVDLHIGWLNPSQIIRLIERVLELPPARSARCLADVVSRLAGARSLERVPPAQLLLDACRRLPAEHRARPLTALLELLRNPEIRAYSPLLHGITDLYDALPPALRPVFDRQHAQVMQESRDQRSRQGITPPGAAVRRHR